jgi:hypothetical protein
MENTNSFMSLNCLLENLLEIEKESHNEEAITSKTSLKRLREIATKKGITKLSKYNSKNRDELIQLIREKETDKEQKNNANNVITNDTYTEQLLKEQYALHKSYVIGRINTTTKIGIKVRLPSIPEDISENIIKHIIRNKTGDTTTRWDCKNGDLHSQKEGKQECKCFTSDGPPSFTPTSDWDVIYFLDARNWIYNDKFILYRIPLKRTSNEWKNIKVNKIQTFEDQTKQGRRPRITWDSLYPQIQNYCNKVYEGTFNDIFERI